MIIDDAARVRIVRAILGIESREFAAKLGISARDDDKLGAREKRSAPREAQGTRCNLSGKFDLLLAVKGCRYLKVIFYQFRRQTMAETALAVPFASDEICEIAVAEFKKRLAGLSPLQGAKEYGAFEIDFAHTIRLHRTSGIDNIDKQTLAWGHVEGGKIDDVPVAELEVVKVEETYKSDPDVNGESAEA